MDRASEPVQYPREVTAVWVFAQYYHEDFYPLEPFEVKLFADFDEMKEYSAKVSAKNKPNYPEYVSMYWKIDWKGLVGNG